MDRYEFLRAVLPNSGGNYIATFGRGEVKWNRHAASIEELADLCADGSSDGLTAYYALGTFTDNLERKPDGSTKAFRLARMANEFKTFALDIDAGKSDLTKCYATGEDALRALIAFIKETRLPVPLTVSSGNGIHAYWPLAEPIPRDQWKEAGVALRALCAKHKLIIDTSKVHDPSMVLRPLDTLNKGKPVRLLIPGAGFHTPNTLITQFGVSAGKQPAKSRVVQSMTKSAVMEDSMIGLEQQPLDATKMASRCQQIALATKDNGAHASYGQWQNALAMARHCIDPEQVAIQWSRGHAGYDETETLVKLHSFTEGPLRCATWDAAMPGVCSKCPQAGKITSPAQIGRPDPKPIDPIQDAQHTPEVAAPSHQIDPMHVAPAVEAPKPFMRTASGVKWDNQGVWLDICQYDAFPSHIVRDPTVGYVMVEWVWRKPHVGYSRMHIKMSAIFNTSSVVDLMGALADHGFLIESKAKQGWMSEYMRAYTQLLQKHQAATELHNSFGWKADYTKFVLGSTEFRREANSTVSTHEVGLSQLISGKHYDETFTAKGDLSLWSQWTAMLNHPSLHLHQVELGRAFATPLMAMTGLRGVVFSLVGKSGRGKSTMQNWCASVYGRPDKVNTTAQDTQMSMVQRLGVWNCLPVGVDEVTLIKPELLANLIYWGTQGQDRNRVTEVTQANQWSLTMSLSTNRSLLDKARTVGADVDAILNRMVELHYPECHLFAESSGYGRRINMMLSDNYGLAGRVYLPYLLSLGEARIKADIEEHMRIIREDYKFEFSGQERYWEVATVLISLGSFYAKQLGLIQFDYTLGIKALLQAIVEQRKDMGTSKLDSYDLITEYLTAFNHTSVSLSYKNGHANVRGEIPRGEVRIRKEFYHTGSAPLPDRGFAYIDKMHLHHWLIAKGFEFRTVQETLTADVAMFRPGRNGRIYMGKDTGVSLPQANVIGISLNHERFRGMLEQYEDPDGIIVDINTTKGTKR